MGWLFGRLRRCEGLKTHAQKGGACHLANQAAAPHLCSPYDSAGSILVYIMMVGGALAAVRHAACLLACLGSKLRCQSLAGYIPALALPSASFLTAFLPPCTQSLIAVDIVISFRVAHYKDSQLVTDKKAIAVDYLKTYFFIDLLSGGQGGLVGVELVWLAGWLGWLAGHHST